MESKDINTQWSSLTLVSSNQISAIMQKTFNDSKDIGRALNSGMLAVLNCELKYQRMTIYLYSKRNKRN